MTTIYKLFLAIVFLAITPELISQNFYLHPNGITCMCPDASIGETGVVNGVTYTKRSREQITPQNAATTCTSGITDMSNLFENMQNFNQNIGSWDVSDVTNMSMMFYTPYMFNQDISSWDVSNVTDMSWMFYNNPFNQPLGNWDVSNVTNMEYMFQNTEFNQPINNWNVGNVTDMSWMLSYCNFNQSIGDWDVSNVTSMKGMFMSSPFNQSIENWNVSNVMYMEGMFEGTVFNQNIGSWNVSNVINMRAMFWNSNFNQSIENWNVSNVTSMMGIFGYYSNFNQPLVNWDVSNVTNMGAMFWNNSDFNQDISGWTFNQDVIFLDNDFSSTAGFISNSNLSVENYDLLLQSLSNQNLFNKELISENLNYCNTNARNDLINIKGWIITGDSFNNTSLIVPANLTVSNDENSCHATNVNLGSPNVSSCFSYTLTNNAPTSFPIGNTNVIWTVTDTSGNTASSTQVVTVVLEPDLASVCYVSSDEIEITKNRVYINNLDWINVEHYQVLRETSTNVFDPVGIITQGESSFLDLTSNNTSQTYRYRVRTLDICNNLSTSSPIHRTILLQSSIATNNSVNLLWNAYEGVSFGTYNIYRKVNDGVFEVIATVPSNNFTYSDTQANVLENNYQYYVAIEVQPCNTGFNNVEIKSNREIIDPNMSIGDVLFENEVIIYPNPSIKLLTISIPDNTTFEFAQIYNISGQMVMEVTERSFSIQNLATATYFIRISTSKGETLKTFIKK